MIYVLLIILIGLLAYNIHLTIKLNAETKNYAKVDYLDLKSNLKNIEENSFKSFSEVAKKVNQKLELIGAEVEKKSNNEPNYDQAFQRLNKRLDVIEQKTLTVNQIDKLLDGLVLHEAKQ